MTRISTIILSSPMKSECLWAVRAAGFQLQLLALKEVLVDAAYLHCSAFAAREAKQSKGVLHREKYFMLLVNVWPLNVILLYRATTYFFFQWPPYHFDLCWWWSVTALGVRQVSFSCSINLPCRIMLMAVISLLSDWNFPLFQPLQNSDKGTS